MKNLIILFITAAIMPVYGQLGNPLKKAERAQGRVQYAKALNYYDKALAENPDSYEANAGKGMLLGEFMDQYEQAIPYLEKALSKSSKDTLLTIYFTLGKCYHFLSEYEKALYCYNKLSKYEEIGNPMFQYYVRKDISDCHYAIAHRNVPPDYKISIRNIGEEINTGDPEYAAVQSSPNELIFTSKRKDTRKEKINEWDGKYFESMYVSKYENGKYSTPKRYTRLDLEKRSKFSKYNESSVSISPDGNTLFLYRGGDIYIVAAKDSTQEPRKLSKAINMAKYQSHAAVSKDNTTLYFSSESKEGYGGTDIYRAVKDESGEWTHAELLDTTINTMFNEDAPFLSEDGTLYFSSNGHQGFGSYDIYKSNYVNGQWTKPVNLGKPINSSGPDIFFSLINNKEGYFSSARPGGYGDLDIYNINLEKSLKADSVPDPMLTISKPEEITPSAPGTKPSQDKYISDKLLQTLNWNSTPLYFKYNEYTLTSEAEAILKNNLKVLRRNKELTVNINGYSDARGPEKYNINLSLNRAQAVKQYLIANGIERNRIKNVEGLGESGLLNKCGDGVACDESLHRLNRRVEIKILNENYKQTGVVSTGNK